MLFRKKFQYSNVGFLNNFTLREYFIFRKKFLGYFISKGNKTFAIKMFNFILNGLKKNKLKLSTNYKNPNNIFYYILLKIAPFLTLELKKIKNSILDYPSLFFGNKKIVLLVNWIARQFKGKSNVYGIKKEDILKNLLEVLNLRGAIYRMRLEHDKKIILARIHLRNEGISFKNSRKQMYSWKKAVYNDLTNKFKKQTDDRLFKKPLLQNTIKRTDINRDIYYKIKRRDKLNLFKERYCNTFLFLKTDNRKYLKKEKEFIFKYKRNFVH